MKIEPRRLENDVMLRFGSVGGESRITFWTNDGLIEALRLEGNGDIYVRGRLVTNDLEVVEGLREFLIEAGHIKRPQ